jgi:hypothetical protein
MNTRYVEIFVKKLAYSEYTSLDQEWLLINNKQ